MGSTHSRLLAVLLILGWLPISYSLLESWPPTQVPHYLALADSLKVEAEKFDKQSPGSTAAADVASSIAQFEEWKRNPSELETLLWHRWLLDLAQLVLGVAAGALLMLKKRIWTVLAVIVSLWYLYEHNLSPIYGVFLRGATSVSDVASRLVIMSKSPGLLVSIVHFDLLLPLLCLWALVVAGFSVLMGRGKYAATA